MYFKKAKFQLFENDSDSEYDAELESNKNNSNSDEELSDDQDEYVGQVDIELPENINESEYEAEIKSTNKNKDSNEELSDDQDEYVGQDDINLPEIDNNSEYEAELDSNENNTNSSEDDQDEYVGQVDIELPEELPENDIDSEHEAELESNINNNSSQELSDEHEAEHELKKNNQNSSKELSDDQEEYVGRFDIEFSENDSDSEYKPELESSKSNSESGEELSNDHDRYVGWSDIASVSSDSCSEVVFRDELKIMVKDFLVDTSTGSKVVLKNFSIPLVNVNCLEAKRRRILPPKQLALNRCRLGPSSFLGVYRCNDCKFKTSHAPAIINHVKTHFKTRRNPYINGRRRILPPRDSPPNEVRIGPSSFLGSYKCNDCSFKTSRKVEMVLHSRIHIYSRYPCSLCPRKFRTEQIYHRHLVLKHKNDMPNITKESSHMFKSCSMCDFTTAEDKYLISHFLQEHANKGYHCSYCDKKAHSHGSILNHMLNSHMKETANLKKIGPCRVHKCSKCTYRNCYKSAMEQHVLGEHTNTADSGSLAKYFCDKCDFNTLLKSSLRAHVAVHVKPSEFKCQYCVKRFFEQSYLNTHLLRCHRDEIPDLEEYFGDDLKSCSFCKYQTMYDHRLKTHTLTHTNPASVNWFKCNKCGYKTVYPSNLRSHLDIVHGDRKTIKYTFTCELCDYKAYKKNLLKRHMDAHTRLQKFECNSCAKVFIKRVDLGRHLLSDHSKEVGIEDQLKSINLSPWFCTLCPFKTVSFFNLNKHTLKVHEGYKCSHCDKVFRIKSDLNVHLVKKHKVKSLTAPKFCRFCDFRTCRNTDLNTHILIEHRDASGNSNGRLKNGNSSSSEDR